jgi:transposase
MWTKENRARYNRDQLRYPSDVTEEEWGQLAALIPPARRGGCQRTVNIREVLNGLLYVLSTGCQWRAIPTDLPPRSTIFDYLERWQADGTLGQIHATLYVRCREQAERETSPSACIIDSQSVKSAEKGELPLTLRALTRANGSKGKSAMC